MPGLEILAQRDLDRVDGLQQVARADQALAQAMNALGQCVIAACHIDQLLELALEHLVAVPQHFDLPLDKADRRALIAQVRKTQFREQHRVALEKIRTVQQEFRDAALFEAGLRYAACVAGRHDSILPMFGIYISIDPVNTFVAGPVSQSGWPGPSQETCAAPPGSSTRTA